MMPERAVPKPRDAMAYLSRKKVIVDPSNDWFNINSGEHAQTFSVAHLASVDMANQIFQFMNEALENGETLADFKKNMKPLMEKTGWYGRDDISKDNKAYINWRLKIMYETNMSTAYSAGHYRQQIRGAEGRPYLLYKQIQRPTKNDKHEPLHNTAMPINDPFWDKYYPPNDYGCGCYTVSISESQYQNGNYKKGVSPNFNSTTVPNSWQFNPGQEVYAPSATKYQNLKNINMADGRSAFQHIRESYRKEMSQYSMTQKEYEKWVDKVLAGETFQDAPHNISTIVEGVVQKIDIDPKIISDGKAIHHGARGRRTVADSSGKIIERDINPEKDFSLKEIKEIPRKLADPEYIFIESGKLNQRIFSYEMKDGKLARIVLRKATETTSLRLITFQKVGSDDLLKNGNMNMIYRR